MCSKTSTGTFTAGCSADRARLALECADAVVIGAGAGLSASAGFAYAGERFRENFADFAEKYGFQDMYTGGFFPFPTPEEHWAYWSRFVYVNRYQNAPRPVYEWLLGLVEGKDYFVLTTNVDHCFQKAGFDKARLFYTQGDYGLFQCSVPCCQETCDNEAVIRKMVESQKDIRVPSALLPVCPRCGKPMTMNLRSDHRFVEDDGWHRAAERYEDFILRHKGLRVLYLELGVGFNTPGIIKYPFWQWTAENPNATYISINRDQPIGPPAIQKQAIYMNGDVGDALAGLLGARGGR